MTISEELRAIADKIEENERRKIDLGADMKPLDALKAIRRIYGGKSISLDLSISWYSPEGDIRVQWTAWTTDHSPMSFSGRTIQQAVGKLAQHYAKPPADALEEATKALGDDQDNPHDAACGDTFKDADATIFG